MSSRSWSCIKVPSRGTRVVAFAIVCCCTRFPFLAFSLFLVMDLHLNVYYMHTVLSTSRRPQHNVCGLLFARVRYALYSTMSQYFFCPLRNIFSCNGRWVLGDRLLFYFLRALGKYAGGRIFQFRELCFYFIAF